MTLSEIQIRDPFILPLAETQTYYLFGTTDKSCWDGPAEGFDCYTSRDLENWEGPIAAFRPPADFWGNTNFWAPEVFAYGGKFFMMATFISQTRHRGTQVLVANAPEGPYEPWSEGPVTPEAWSCLDGTLFVDEAGQPWMAFCHEWTQIHDGTICAIRLSPDLKAAASEPFVLFNGSKAPWGRNIGVHPGEVPAPKHVTDGPFFYRTQNGALLMLWSSTGPSGYAMGIARSETGAILGPWTQDETPLWGQDGGHGMIFQAFDGRLFLTLHSPNQTPNERAILRELVEEGDSIRLKS